MSLGGIHELVSHPVDVSFLGISAELGSTVLEPSLHRQTEIVRASIYAFETTLTWLTDIDKTILHVTLPEMKTHHNIVNGDVSLFGQSFQNQRIRILRVFENSLHLR